MLDKGLTEIGHKTDKHFRGSVYAGKYDNSTIAHTSRSRWLLKYLKEILNSWNPAKKPKVWIVHHPTMGIFSIFARKKQLIYICHGPWSEEAANIGKDNLTNRIANMLRRQLQKLLINKSHDIFFLSNYMSEQVARSLNMSSRQKAKFKLITPIVDQGEEKSHNLNDENIPRSTGFIYICRRLVERTGVGDFLEKFALSERCKDYNILIAGDGPEKERIKSIKTKYHLENCQLLGFIDEKTHKMNFKKSEFMLMPSLSNEGFGLVIIESISCGCIPILSKDAGGGKEWMEKIFPRLIYDGSIDSLLQSLEYAKQNKTIILESLMVLIMTMTKEEAAKTIEEACIRRK